MKASLLASRWGCLVIGLTALLPSALGESLFNLEPDLPPGVSSELLLDRSALETQPAGLSGVRRETMLEGPIPEPELPSMELQTKKRSLFTIDAGPFLFIFSGDASAIYNDNIFLAPRNPEADILTTLTPQVVMGAGDYAEQKKTFFAGGFAPSFINFRDHTDLSGTEYDAFVEGQYCFSRLKIGSRLTYQKLSGDDQDASGRIKRQLYTADLLAEYELSQTLLAEVYGQYTHRDYLSRIDSDEYFDRVFLAKQLSPKLEVALGGAFGTFLPANLLNQTYEQPLVRVWYQPTPKVTVRAIGGIEFRQTAEGLPPIRGIEFRQTSEGIRARKTPVADVTVAYSPSQNESTVLSVGGYRRVLNSVSDPTQNYITNGIVFHVTQRIWRDLYLDVGAGYQHTSYYPVAREVVVTHRKDDSFYVRPKVRYDFNKWGSVSMFYLWRNNDSTVAGDSWENEQVGVDIAVGF